MSQQITGDRSNESSSFFVIGGCGSSGTTLLTHLLSSHPEIASGPEFNLFNHYELYDFQRFKEDFHRKIRGKCDPSGYVDSAVFMTHREHYGLSERVIATWLHASHDLPEFISHVLHHMAERYEVPYFLEKSPTNAYCFPELASTFPAAKLIHVVRDGRDVVCSLSRRGFNLFGAASRWLYDTMCGLSVRDTPNYYEVKYEDLVRSPANTLSSIHEFLGVARLPNDGTEKVSPGAGTYSEDWRGRDVPRVWTRTPSDPVSPESIGRHKNQLSREDLVLLDRVRLRSKIIKSDMPNLRSFAELLVFLGYEAPEYPASRHLRAPIGRTVALQIEDYERRLSRFVTQYGFRVPRVYTYIR